MCFKSNPVESHHSTTFRVFQIKTLDTYFYFSDSCVQFEEKLETSIDCFRRLCYFRSNASIVSEKRQINL